jgi:hypothetical protein
MEQCAGCRDVLSAVGVGEEPIVADAVSSDIASDEAWNSSQHRPYLTDIPIANAFVFPLDNSSAFVVIGLAGMGIGMEA